MTTPTVAQDSNAVKPDKTPTSIATKSMEAAKHAMNSEFCFIERLPGIAVIPTLDDPEIHVYSRGELVHSICSDRNINRKNVAAAWMAWPQRNKARSLTYAPGQPQMYNGCLNTWLPSAIKPKKGDLSHWNRYLDHIFASDSTYREWFIAWLAYQFQHPGTKLHSACVFWSEQTATGKSLFGYIMAELFGLHNFSEIGEADLHGQFNFWAARKQFVMGEEIKGANAQRHADAIKALITRKNVTINTKNTPHYVLPDCINYFFTSNHPEAFYLDETDRRFFVHRLGNKKLGEVYVDNTFKPWLVAGGYAAVLQWLLDIDLSKPVLNGSPFNPYAAAPQTSARRAMIDAGRDEIDVWLEEIAPADSPTFSNGWELATAEDLHADFMTAYPRAKIAYRAFVSKLRSTLHMVRGGNRIQVVEGAPAKRIYATAGGWRGYEGATAVSLITSYSTGR